MAKSRKPIHVEPLSDKEAQELVRLVEKATKEFEGIFDDLEAAIGMLMIGRLVGWRVLYLIHNKRTIRKYERILGDINIREIFDEEGPMAHKSLALNIVKKMGSFWKYVSGDEKLDGRRELVRS